MTTTITTADEFFDTYVRDGAYDREGGHAALQKLHNTDRGAFYRLMTSPEFVARAVANAHAFGIVDEVHDNDAEIDELIAEAEELEERAAHLRASADALRDA